MFMKGGDPNPPLEIKQGAVLDPQFIQKAVNPQIKKNRGSSQRGSSQRGSSQSVLNILYSVSDLTTAVEMWNNVRGAFSIGSDISALKGLSLTTGMAAPAAILKLFQNFKAFKIAQKVKDVAEKRFAYLGGLGAAAELLGGVSFIASRSISFAANLTASKAGFVAAKVFGNVGVGLSSVSFLISLIPEGMALHKAWKFQGKLLGKSESEQIEFLKDQLKITAQDQEKLDAEVVKKSLNKDEQDMALKNLYKQKEARLKRLLGPELSTKMHSLDMLEKEQQAELLAEIKTSLKKTIRLKAICFTLLALGAVALIGANIATSFALELALQIAWFVISSISLGIDLYGLYDELKKGSPDCGDGIALTLGSALLLSATAMGALVSKSTDSFIVLGVVSSLWAATIGYAGYKWIKNSQEEEDVRAPKLA